VADGVRDPIVGYGLYGVLAHSVERRRHEIGVRMALGASRSDVRAMIMRHGMSLALAGVPIGLAGAFVLSRALRFLVFGVSATDPVIFVAVPLLLLAVALVATWLPPPDTRHAWSPLRRSARPEPPPSPSTRGLPSAGCARPLPVGTAVAI
jgi:predicted lysophospholipase L1 biosynthesis ABC-type transport system permease subunit